jgi:hypothetical protein
MVHALQEARRVLKPNGLLLDLRPGAVHRRIGVEAGGRYEPAAGMGEKLDEDHAADRAVKEVIQRGLFKQVRRATFDCRRVMALKDFSGWLRDFGDERQAWEERLIRRVEEACRSRPGKKKIVVNGPLVLRVLQVVKAR